MTNLIQQQQQLLSQTLDRSNVPGNVTHLPRLQIPNFSGDYKDWPSFKDLFQAAVHDNDSISPSQKFQYLKGVLKGNAASLTKHLTLSDAIYSEAWNILKDRFDRKSHIATSFIKTYLEAPGASQVSLKSLRSLCDTFDEVIRGLKALGQEAEQRDPWLIHLALLKVDSDTREHWAKEVMGKDFPTIKEFLTFLNKRCLAMEAASAVPRKVSSFKSLFTSSTNKSSPCCKFCNAAHFIYQCPQFKGETPSKRRTFVTSNSLCFKCLSTSHAVKACHSKMKCNKCKGNHHWLLHDSTQRSQNSPRNPSSATNNSNSAISLVSSGNPASSINDSASSINHISEASSINHISAFKPLNETHENLATHSNQQAPSSFNTSVEGSVISLLPTAQVLVKDCSGHKQKCRILLDSGSQISLISDACVQRLGLRGQNAQLSLTGLSSAGIGVTRGKVSLDLASCWDSSKQVQIVAFIMNKLIPSLPSENFTIPNLQRIHDVKLADPSFHTSSPIDIILGADKFFDVLCPGRTHGLSGGPTLHETIFGWVLSGALPTQDISVVQCHKIVEDVIGQILQRFWQT